MKEFIKKLIGRLEEKKSEHLHDEKVMQELCKNNLASFCSAKARELDGAIEIVNQLAEEYKQKSAWQSIYDKVVSLEHEYAENGEEDAVNDCIRLENLLQYFKEELQSTEECSLAGGWIPCSKLPEKDGIYLCKVFHANDYVVWIMRFNNGEFLRPDDVENLDYELIEWKYI